MGASKLPLGDLSFTWAANAETIAAFRWANGSKDMFCFGLGCSNLIVPVFMGVKKFALCWLLRQ
jgi:hypothetical protein